MLKYRILDKGIDNENKKIKKRIKYKINKINFDINLMIKMYI